MGAGDVTDRSAVGWSFPVLTITWGPTDFAGDDQEVQLAHTSNSNTNSNSNREIQPCRALTLLRVGAEGAKCLVGEVVGWIEQFDGEFIEGDISRASKIGKRGEHRQLDRSKSEYARNQ